MTRVPEPDPLCADSVHDAVLHTVHLLHCLALLSGYLSPSVNFVYYIKFDSVLLIKWKNKEKNISPPVKPSRSRTP